MYENLLFYLIVLATLLVVNNSASKPILCRYIFSTPSSAGCRSITSLRLYLNQQLYIDDNTLLFAAPQYSLPYKLYNIEASL